MLKDNSTRHYFVIFISQLKLLVKVLFEKKCKKHLIPQNTGAFCSKNAYNYCKIISFSDSDYALHGGMLLAGEPVHVIG